MKKSIPIAKITRPGAEGILPRKRLFRLLDQTRHRPVTWVSGPPGSGKTSLIASYLDIRKLPCLWYQVDERDSDLATFFFYMGRAVKQVSPRHRNPLPLLTSEYSLNVSSFTKRYFEDLYGRLKSPMIIVFDNYQAVAGPSPFHEMIVQGLEAIPEGINVFIVSRNEPPPPFARLRANNMIDLLGWDEIRFTLEEARNIFHMTGKRQPSEEILLELHTKTEGWAAGLVLIMMSSRIRKIDYRSMTRFPTAELYDYFAIEIFEKIAREAQTFLLQSAFLPNMTVEMAEKLTGVKASREILSFLSENNYFTGSHLHTPRVYQYHPLFKDFLLDRGRAELSADSIASLRRKAAQLSEESGKIEDAAELFCDGKDWEGLAELVIRRARSLIAQGRAKTVEKWIASIPETARQAMPWLLYWLGVCKQPFAPSESRSLFEQAFKLFQIHKDEAGMLQAWSRVVDTILYEGDNFGLLDSWIEWLTRQIRHRVSFPSQEIEAQVASSMSGALVWRQPQHPDIKTWIKKALSLAQDVGDIGLRMQACLHASTYYAWTGDLLSCTVVMEEIRKMAKQSLATPLVLLTWKWTEALMHNRFANSSEDALKSVQEGLSTAQKSGIHVWDHMLYAQGIYASLNKGDLPMAEGFLNEMETTLENSRRHGLCQYYYLSAWYNILSENISRASLCAEMALTFSRETGAYFTQILCALVMAQVLSERKELNKADLQLSAAKFLARKSGSLILQYMCLIKEAQFSLDHGIKEEKRGLEALRKAMKLGRKHGYLNLFPWWQPSVMARLCAWALSEGIEVQFVQNLIRVRKLVLDPSSSEVDDWPWALKIYTLGGFRLLKDGKPVEFSGKVQRKPLELLKTLIALGGAEIGEEHVVDLLWPDADGDAAHSAFTTTLSRLRRLLGTEKAIRFHEGRATVDPHYCWIDVWAFARMVGKVEALWKAGDPGSQEQEEEATKLARKAMDLYAGNFLPGDEGLYWTASYRGRFKDKYLRLVGKLGAFLTRMDRWEEAMDCYQRALEIDPLAEEVYQQIMICYRRLGQPTKAIEVYQRCKKTLSTLCGLNPSPKTEAIYRTLAETGQVS